MPNARFAPRNFHDEATLTATTEATGYPIGNTTYMARDRVWRSGAIGAGAPYDEPPTPTPSAEQIIEGHWGETGRVVNVIALFRHNLYGASVRVQLFDDIAMGGGDEVYDSTAFDVYDVPLAEGYEWGIDGLGTSTDRFFREAPIVLYPNNIPAAAYRITIDESSDTSLGGLGADYYEIGRIRLGKCMEVEINPDYGLSLGIATNDMQSRSRGGSVRAWRGARWRQMSMNLGAIVESERSAWLDIMRECQLSRDLFVSIFPGAGGRQERDYTMEAVMASLDPIIWGNFTWRNKRLTLIEV